MNLNLDAWKTTAVLLLALYTGWAAAAQDANQNPSPPPEATDVEPATDKVSHKHSHSHDLAELSLEQLIDVEVTTVSKKEERLFEASSAVTIISGEDIRRSGMTSIPEALRLAPGVQVGRVTSHDWGISARGFNNLFANKLLVLMDGRSVYTPLFSGTFWDVQDTMLEDIERIEVIRGPGASLWGANAVNGVINVITRSSSETQGALISGGGGSEETAFGQARYGGHISENTHYRVYGKYFKRDNSALRDGSDANDAARMSRGGFRTDWEPSWGNVITFQGDLYDGDLDQAYLNPSLTDPFVTRVEDVSHVKGANLISRWEHDFSAFSDMQIQAYYDLTERRTSLLDEQRHTLNVDFQHRVLLGEHERQEFIWGGGYNYSNDEQNGNNFILDVMPDQLETHLFNGFLQSETALLEDHVKLTLGAKLEHNDFTGLEFQPAARLTLTPNSRNTIWASVAHAVRTPSRVEDGVRVTASVLPGTPPTAYTLLGSAGFESEELTAYEIGYRVQLHDTISADLALFYNDYDNLRSFNPGTPFLEQTPLPEHLVLPVTSENDTYGETYGGELALEYSPLDWWRWRASYSYLQMQLHQHGLTTGMAETDEGTSPHNQVVLRSSMDLPGNWELDLIGRYVDNLPTFDIPSYFTADVRLAWRPIEHLELSIVGQNLVDDQHPEFSSSFIAIEQTEVERSVYGKLTVKF